MPDKGYKRIVAREWLIFVALLLIGIVCVASFYHGYLTTEYRAGYQGRMEQFYREVTGLQLLSNDLFSRGRDWGVWAKILAPYLIVQLGRSLFWSVRTLTRKQ